MSTTTDPHGRPKTGLHGEGVLDRVTDTGGSDRYASEDQHGILTGNFDREINVRGILWSGFWLAVVTIAANVLMWWFLRGFQMWDDKHEVKMAPMAVQNPQRAPGGPLLQPENPVEDRNEDMFKMHRDEQVLLDHAGWVDREGGTLRVPVDVAIDVIAQRGVAPFPATGGAAQAPTTSGLPAGQTAEATTPAGAPAAAAKPPAR